MHVFETFFLEKKLIEKKGSEKGVERGQKGSGDPFFPDRYFPPKTYSDEKINICDMMLGISPCISAYKLNEI